MILGRSLDQIKLDARAAAVAHYSDEQAKTRPATLQAMDMLKLAEAKTVLALGHSDMIEQEAALRGITPLALARQVKDLADATIALELKRQKLNLDIDKAASHVAVKKLLETAGVAWPA